MHEIGCFALLGILLVCAIFLVCYPLKGERIWSLGLASLILAGSIAGYLLWGGFFSWHAYHLDTKRLLLVKNLLKNVKTSEALIAKLKAQVERHPESVQGWYLLGRLYASSGNWLEAKKMFAKAYSLKALDEAVAVNFALSLWQLNNRLMSSQIRTILEKILQYNPNQLDALHLFAEEALSHHQYALSLDYWEKILRLLPENSENALAVRKVIAEINKKILNAS